ncbi:MAG: DUF4974 domain-containing protein, partial [Paramuribaculum sp.]|nr:DUF4974 domain-containing protein [Paramuribaculum sp.]
YVAGGTGIETAGPAASVEEAVAPEKQIRTIDFENAPLEEVVARISEVYGVSITDVPAEASDYRLSLHYEGNVVDLVGTINELLAIDLKIVEERNGDGR